MRDVHYEAKSTCSQRGGATTESEGVEVCVGLDFVQGSLDGFGELVDLSE